LRRGFKKWCEDKSVQIRKQLGFASRDRLHSQVLADYLGITVISPIEIPNLEEQYIERLVGEDPSSWSAITIKVDGHTIIISNSRHSRPRHESDVMHELSHVILGHEPALFGSVPWFPFPLREYKKEDEEEAAWFGSCLQIPRSGLPWTLRSGMSEREIARHFCASVDMIRYRRNVTGVDKQLMRSHRRG
jgi:Zn-dependent peptidase ImmA (M78 family)